MMPHKNSVIRGSGLEYHFGASQSAAGEMNAEISRVLLEGAVDLFAVLTMSHDTAFAQGGERV